MSVALGDPLIAKYDIASPRYTSYPTVPYWDSAPTADQWIEHIGRALQAAEASLGLYVHIPFCRTLCTFCGCNTRITRSHSIVGPYIQALLAELDLYRQRLGCSELEFGELQLGGGTPTFLTVEELEALLSALYQRARPRRSAMIASVEVDPRVTDPTQLALLARYGFRSLSLGVQDFDPRVQDIVNRVQSEAQVQQLTEAARVLGFESVSYDLIYGLPLQTRTSIDATMNALERLRPDRVALYAYAHVPWIKPGQRRFTDSDLPESEEKRELYELGRERLTAQGYREIGLDHFALASDGLWQAQQAGRLHRNFMGYTSAYSRPIIGLGVSSIGDAGDAFAQNEKDLQRYHERIANGELPLQRGHVLDTEDRILRRHILRLMTQRTTRWDQAAEYTPFLATIGARLAEPAADELVLLEEKGCRITERGRPFLRNICMAFDARLARRMPEKLPFR
ncbi:MAG TPA: oxygen-independent coproporphyrinogen III oxidase [Steroidobacteraceae bacterium]|jgi:oxygen-independent coproporphyrinogen-3 oxidase|nr:oxygen-independent coproporphyrinogen III oxidase [Steroidobacteraceae bacterium]